MKKVALINDLSGLGKCSLTAAIPIYSCLGIQPCPLPTAILSNQTGYSSYFMDDYTEKMVAFSNEWSKRKINFDAISTGFLINSNQIDFVEDFLNSFKNNDTLLVVDPVMGDGGQMYKTVSNQLCKKIRLLALKADVITPNLTEACILLEEEPVSSLPVKKVKKMAEKLMKHGIKKVVITGVVYEDKIYNIIGNNNDITHISNSMIHKSYSGTGDLLTSILTAGILLNKHNFTYIVKTATDFIEMATAQAFHEKTDHNDGVAFEEHLPFLWQALK